MKINYQHALMNVRGRNKGKSAHKEGYCPATLRNRGEIQDQRESLSAEESVSRTNGWGVLQR